MPVYIVHLSARDALDAVRAARDRGVDGLRRDLPAVPVPVARRPRQRVRGREVRLLAAAPPGRPLGGALDRPDQGRPPARLDGPLPVRLPGPEGARPGRLPQDPERPARASRTGSTCSTTAASSRGRITRERWVEIVSTAPAKLFGMYPRKGAIAVGSDADIVDLRPEPATGRSRAKTHHMDVDYSCYEGRAVRGRSRHRPEPRLGHRPRRRVHGPQGRREVHQARDRRLRPDQLSGRRRRATSGRRTT